MSAKTVVNVNVGDYVRVRNEGQCLADADVGIVRINNAKQCVVEKSDGLTVTIFGKLEGNSDRRWPGVVIEKL